MKMEIMFIGRAVGEFSVFVKWLECSEKCQAHRSKYQQLSLKFAFGFLRVVYKSIDSSAASNADLIGCGETRFRVKEGLPRESHFLIS